MVYNLNMQITPYAKNAKKHPTKQIQQLADIVREVGWRQPILVNQEGVIVAGHGRWETYQQNQDLAEPWVIDDAGKTIMGEPASTLLSKEQEMAYRLADNKLAETDVDMGLVIEELKELEALGELAPLTGYDMDLTIEADEADDEVPDVPEEPRSKLGDLYELGEHRVLCGDSTKLEDVEQLMDGKKADMVFTDPPYNLETKGGWDVANRPDLDFIANFNPVDFLNTLPVFYESKKMNAYVFCNKELLPDYLVWARDAGYSFNVLVWKKPNAIPIGDSHRPDIEYLLLFRKNAIWNNGLSASVNYSRLIESPRETGLHPTMKPVGIITNQLQISSHTDSIVVDAFLGSGSTLIAAEKTGRICYGMELDPRYISVILDRWQQYTGKDPILKETADSNDSRKGLAWSAIKSLNHSESS
jgi:DNA modification methylase